MILPHGISLQNANWRDLNGLRQLEQACFPKDAWPLLDLIGVLITPGVVRLKAVSPGGEMIGFIAGDDHLKDGLAWIATLGVLPDFRRQGIGQALLEACEQRLQSRRIRLNVRYSNHAAIRLYERNGYQRIGIWEKYYQDGEHALVMEKVR